MRLITYRQLAVSGLVSVLLSVTPSVIAAPEIKAGFSPEGTALPLVLDIISRTRQSIRLMGYSFTSPEVTRSLIEAHRRGVDVRVVLDEKANTGRASVAAMNLLVNADISVRTVSAFKSMHDKTIVSDGRHVQLGSFNYSRAADKSNSENVLVVREAPELAASYLQHWQSRWEQGTDFKTSY